MKNDDQTGKPAGVLYMRYFLLLYILSASQVGRWACVEWGES